MLTTQLFFSQLPASFARIVFPCFTTPPPSTLQPHPLVLTFHPILTEANTPETHFSHTLNLQTRGRQLPVLDVSDLSSLTSSSSSSSSKCDRTLLHDLCVCLYIYLFVVLYLFLFLFFLPFIFPSPSLPFMIPSLPFLSLPIVTRVT